MSTHGKTINILILTEFGSSLGMQIRSSYTYLVGTMVKIIFFFIIKLLIILRKYLFFKLLSFRNNEKAKR